MSGGHFDYQQHQISNIVEELERIVSLSPEDRILYPWYNYTEKTLEEFKTAITYLRIAFVYAERLDYLISSDDGEETFHERLKNDLKEVSPLFL